MSDKQVRAQYMREFKLEAVRQARSGRAVAVVAKVLGESPRVSRRLNTLRGLSHEEDEQVLARGA